MKIFLLCIIWFLVLSTVYGQSDTVVIAPPGTITTVPDTETEVVPSTGEIEVVPETEGVPIIDEGGGNTGDYDQGIPIVTDEAENNNRDNVIWDRSSRSTVDKTEDEKNNTTHHVVVVMPGLPGLPGLPGNPGQATLQMKRTGTNDFRNCRFNVSGNYIFLCNYTDDGNETDGSLNEMTNERRTTELSMLGESTDRPLVNNRNDSRMKPGSEELMMEGSNMHSIYRQYNDSDIDPGFNHFPWHSHHYHLHHNHSGNFTHAGGNRSSNAVNVINNVDSIHSFSNDHDNGRRPITVDQSTAMPVKPLTETEIGYENGNLMEVVKVPTDIIKSTEPSVRGPETPESRQLHFEAVELEVDDDRSIFPNFPKLTFPPINLPSFNFPSFPPISSPGSTNPGGVVVGQPGMPGESGMPGTPGEAVFSSSTASMAVNKAPLIQRAAPVAVIPNAVRPAAVPVIQSPGVLPVGGGYGQYPMSPYGEIPGVSSSSYLGRPGSAISSQASVSGIGGAYPGIPGGTYPGIGYPGYPITGSGVSPIIGQPGYPGYPGLYPGYGGVGGGYGGIGGLAQNPYYPGGGYGGIGGIGGGYPIAG